jgi:hypothetical protein
MVCRCLLVKDDDTDDDDDDDEGGDSAAAAAAEIEVISPVLRFEFGGVLLIDPDTLLRCGEC